MGALVPSSGETNFPVLTGFVDTDYIKTIKGDLVPNGGTHFPVLAGARDPDFIKKTVKGARTEIEANTLAGTCGHPRSRLYRKTNKGEAGTELEANTPAGTSGRRRHRLYQKSIKGEHVPNSRNTLAGTSGDHRYRLYTKSNKAAPVPNSRKTHFPVLQGSVDTDFNKKPINGGRRTRGKHTCRHYRAHYVPNLSKRQ